MKIPIHKLSALGQWLLIDVHSLVEQMNINVELYFVIFSEKFKETSFAYKSKTKIPVGDNTENCKIQI